MPVVAVPQEQEEVFREYAGEVLREYRAHGRNTAPIELHLAKKPNVEHMQ